MESLIAIFIRYAAFFFLRALTYWDEVSNIPRPIYKNMPLTPYNGSSHDRNDDNLFHWALIRPEVANDIAIAKSAKDTSGK